MEDADGELSPFTQMIMDFTHAIGINDSHAYLTFFIVFLFTIKGLIKYGEGAYAARLQSDLRYEITTKMFRKYSKMDYSYYAKHDTGHFINQLTTQTSGLVSSFVSFKTFLTLVVTTVSYYVFAMLADWLFALLATLMGFSILLIMKGLGGYHKKLSRKTVKEWALINKLLVQSMQSFKYLNSTGEAKLLEGRLFISLKNAANYARDSIKATALTKSIREPIGIAFLMLIILFQTEVMNTSIMSSIIALLLIHRALASVFDLQMTWQTTMTNIGSLETVEAEFEKLKLHQEFSGQIKMDKFKQSINFQGVSFGYGDKSNQVLKGIDLKIRANQSVAFVGGSGTGKSTVVDLITLLLRPNFGVISIDGVNSNDIDLQSWRRQIGYISQDVVIFDDTIANNIGMWRSDYANDKIYQNEIKNMAKKVGLHKFISSLDDEYGTIVGDRGIRLSGGQKQRLFIARELFKNPGILILDEATSSLDSKTEKIITSNIDTLRGEVTLIVVAHRLSTIKNIDCIYVLDNGKIVESGSYNDLIEQGEIFYEMAKLQSL
jgi:subfamily B ATP-binding cassette protein MsbA